MVNLNLFDFLFDSETRDERDSWLVIRDENDEMAI